MSTPEQAASVAALTRTYDVTRARTRLNLQMAIRRLWWQFLVGTDPDTPLAPADTRRIAAALAGARIGELATNRLYDDAEIRRLAKAMARSARAGQLQSASLSAQFQRQLLAALGQPRRATLRVELPAAPRGIAPEIVWQRPAAEFRYQRSRDVAEVEALARALRRAEVIAEDDAMLGEREGARQALTAARTITGYRRIIRPELSRDGTCGLCIAASDRLYHVADLLPIHARCNCTVVPVIGDTDPGQRINRDDLDRLYEAAGSTDAAALKKVRVVEYDHGELGPILRDADHSFRDQDEARRATRRSRREITPGGTPEQFAAFLAGFEAEVAERSAQR